MTAVILLPRRGVPAVNKPGANKIEFLHASILAGNQALHQTVNIRRRMQ